MPGQSAQGNVPSYVPAQSKEFSELCMSAISSSSGSSILSVSSINSSVSLSLSEASWLLLALLQAVNKKATIIGANKIVFFIIFILFNRKIAQKLRQVATIYQLKQTKKTFNPYFS